MERWEVQQKWKFPLLYILICSAWIIISDLVVWYFTDYDHQAFSLELAKGFLFVLITGAFLYYLMRRYFRIINSYYDSMMETQRTLANLIVNLPGFIYRCRDDENWTVDYISDGCKEITGYEASAFSGDSGITFGDIIPAEDRDLVRETIAKSIHGNTPYQMVYRIQTASGENRWVWEKGIKVSSEDGKSYYLEGFVTDVTQLKRMEEEKGQLERQLLQAKKLETIGRLTGSVIHDFNNILLVIKGYSDLVLRRAETSDPMIYRNINEIKKTGERALQLTNQLLTYTRRSEIQQKAVNINELIESIAEVIRQLLKPHVQLKMVLDPGVKKFLADPVQVDQIVMNLAINARDAMLKGGTLTFETYTTIIEPEEIREIPESRPGEYVVLKASDTGEGIPEMIMHLIFEPFFTTKENGQGTGLGLSIIYGIVKRYNGFIQVKSKPGEGSIFTIYFPALNE